MTAEKVAGKTLEIDEWLSLAESAQYLSSVLKNDVTPARILRLALSRKLTLSVRFVNPTPVKVGRIVRLDDCRLFVFPKVRGQRRLRCLPEFVRASEEWPEAVIRGVEDGALQLSLTDMGIGQDKVLELAEEVTGVQGIYDLPLLWEERNVVERLYQGLTGGPEFTNVFSKARS